MRKTLPPLNALKCFEASARHQSFTKAAEELCVTQGAISKQIKLLEDHLGITLFERKHHILLLTPEGEHYLASISHALNIIEQATDSSQIRERAETLHIAIAPTLSNKWFIPLLDSFTKQYPQVTIRLEAGSCQTDYDTPDTLPTDIAISEIREKPWKYVTAEKIMDEELVPVCSPGFLSGIALNNPQKLLEYKLLQHTKRPNMWEEYLGAAGMEHVTIKHSMELAHFYMLIQAAIDGMGIALIPKIFIEEELQHNKLIIAYAFDFKSPYSCYLMVPKHKNELRKIRNFRRWLLSVV